ncbi:T9SS type A sorting domain-containing protein [Cytophaga aurantiaca]|uniref:T9SS type A sorting domain-containing protein n=1 Tax=Cytophaga aurantiaca TaxID=29530 RepID=UPI000382E16D|nr:T9SS type A sorting domain-containing protein [Cytophaga aurantiaca]
MKKIFFLLFFSLQILWLQAANISVSIVNFSFQSIPNALNIGDVITWTNNDAATHTVTSTSVPGGAATFDANVTTGSTFQYTITVAGSYAYKCSFHSSMTSTFTVANTTTPVVKPTLTLNALYPNPCIDYVHIETAQTIKTVDVYSEAGVLIVSRSFSSNKIDLSVSMLEKGIYFIRIESADGLVETRRIIKN